MVFRGDFLRQSPRCPVYWGPWRSDTITLQSTGWDLSVSHNRERDELMLAIRHREFKLYGFSDRVPHPRRTMRDPFYGEGAAPTFVMQRVCVDPHVLPDFTMGVADLSTFEPIDARSRIIEVTSKADIDPLFAPVETEAPEIIVEPATVQGLLDQIRAMQAPEQAAIRKRNAQRERDAEPARKFHASIVTLAA
jgi:hypothetical protein